HVLAVDARVERGGEADGGDLLDADQHHAGDVAVEVLDVVDVELGAADVGDRQAVAVEAGRVAELAGDGIAGGVGAQDGEGGAEQDGPGGGAGEAGGAEVEVAVDDELVVAGAGVVVAVAVGGGDEIDRQGGVGAPELGVGSGVAGEDAGGA